MSKGIDTVRGGLKRASGVNGGEADWLRRQKAIFGRFIEQRIKHGGIKGVEITDILKDLSDGVIIVQLMEVLSGEKWPNKPCKSGLGRIQAVDQINNVLKWLESLKVDLKRCSAEDVLDGNDKAVFGMLFSIILKYVKLDDEDDADSGGDVREALKLWFQNKTHGYDNVTIKDFKGSFHDGLALCAVIHKMRPKLIPYETLEAGKANGVKNLTLALEKGDKYCNVPAYLGAEDIAELDEVSMVVYLFDWYYGVALLQKQDVAARRIGKLIVMTKLHDKMRADYTAAAEAMVAWVDSKVAWLNAIAFDNTLGGIRKLLEELYAYKSGEKATNVASNLDNNALYTNLAVRLKQANRPDWAPAGLCPTDLDAKIEALDAVEREVSVKMQKELARQLELDKLQKRFRANAESLKAWVATEEAYMAKAETAALTDEAKENLYQHELKEKDVKNARATRLADLIELAAKLDGENYEKKDEINALKAELEASFDGLDSGAAAKRTTLEADVAREEAADDAACKAFADLVEAFVAWSNDEKKKMAEATGELAEQLTALDAQIAEATAAESKVAEITKAQEAIDARNVTTNPHTTVLTQDCAAIHQQLRLLLQKKRELLVSQMEEKETAGLTEEMLKEINDNFAYFDKDNSGSISKKELRKCLASLGEDSAPADVDKILEQYDTNKSGTITLDEFTNLMKDRQGDSNTAEEITQGWNYLTFDKPLITEDPLRILVNDLSWTEAHVDYLVKEQKDSPFPAEGMDHATWTKAVFDR